MQGAVDYFLKYLLLDLHRGCIGEDEQKLQRFLEGFVLFLARHSARVGWKFMTFVTFHMLVLVEMGISGCIWSFCVSHFAQLTPTERIFRHKLWLIAKLSQNLNGAFSEREKRKSPEAVKKLRRFEERARETDLRLEYTQKLHILKIEQKGLKSLSKK